VNDTADEPDNSIPIIVGSCLGALILGTAAYKLCSKKKVEEEGGENERFL